MSPRSSGVRAFISVAALSAGLAVSPAAASAHRHHLPHARGGHVHHAWPARGAKGRPSTPLARWLARQVGPAPRSRTAHMARLSADASGPQARLAARATNIPFQGTGPVQALALVRSYAIPADDPSAGRLANLSWTYDSAVSAVAFTEYHDLAEAQQLLSQLSALQRTDGSIDFAFNTGTGQSLPEFRAGTIAWAGLAAVVYRAATCSTAYDALAAGAARWLLADRVMDASSPAYGLMLGGPDVSWVSTQHNLIARAFLARLADAIQGKVVHDGHACAGGLQGLSASDASAFADQLRAAVRLLDAGIQRSLFVRLTPQSGPGRADDPGLAYFREGVGDDVIPSDVQAFGALWLFGQGRVQDARAVLAYADHALPISGVSISLSANPLTYNETWSATGPFQGYLPYANANAPHVLWFEGTLELHYAQLMLGQGNSALEQSIGAWERITGPAEGPLQADQSVLLNVYNEYHPWPAAAPAAWELLTPTSFSALSGR